MDVKYSLRDRILVVEDDERLAAIVSDGLAYHGFHAEAVGDGHACLAAVQADPPQLVVLDLMLPGLDGIEVCRRLRATCNVPVIMLTARGTMADKIVGLDCGADDYLTKPFAIQELAARVRAVLRRYATGAASVLRVADLSLDARGRRVWRGERIVGLTAREFDLLECLMQHTGQVLSHTELLERVWRYSGEVESNAVRVYVTYLRQKLNAAGERDLIHAVRGIGYVLRG